MQCCFQHIYLLLSAETIYGPVADSGRYSLSVKISYKVRATYML